MLIGNGSAIGSVARRLRPAASNRSRPSSETSTSCVAPWTARSAATRATPGPHIIPWPPGEATVTPSIGGAVGRQRRPDDRQVIGRVVDGRRPDLAQGQVARRRDEAGQPRPHLLVERPVDRERLARDLRRVAPAEQQAALLETPVEPLADVEDHRHRLDREGRVRLEDGDRVAGRPDRDADAGQATDRAQPRAAGQQDALGLDHAGVGLDRDDARAAVRVGAVRRPVKAVRSRSSTPAACIASE